MPASPVYSPTSSGVTAARSVVERITSDGSRPTFSHHSLSTRPLCAIVSTSPKACQIFACCATSRSMTFSPEPPIRIGSEPLTGPGFSLPRRASMRSSASSKSCSRDCTGPERVAVLAVVALEPARADAEDRATPEMWSSVRPMSASRSGLRYVLQLTSAPTCARSVDWAIAASVVQHSKCAPSGSPKSG